jgi:hypothetical protein
MRKKDQSTRTISWILLLAIISALTISTYSQEPSNEGKNSSTQTEQTTDSEEVSINTEGREG